MKKYTKPAIEIVEANLSTNCMQGLNSEPGNSGQYLSPGKKDADDEDDFGIEDW